MLIVQQMELMARDGAFRKAMLTLAPVIAIGDRCCA
jgi:hypothetical protein